MTKTTGTVGQNVKIFILTLPRSDILTHRLQFPNFFKLGRITFEGKPEELKGNKQMIKELFL
jgi:hypothetical protein